MTKDQWFLVCIIGALAIVAFAVGVPYLITHKGMRSPDDPANRSEARAYFRRKRRLQRQEDTASAQLDSEGKQQTSGSPHGRRPG